MTLQQLHYFVTACKYNNISRAAEDFNISQPSISTAIKNLENEFGLSLIRRRQTGFALTKDGENFKQMAQAILDQAESVKDVMVARGRNSHLVRLGMPPMASAILFPQIYASFCRENPDIEIVTKEAGRDDLLELFDNNLLDLAFIPHTGALPSEFLAIPVARYETVCCVPKSHPLAGKEAVTPYDLEKEPLVLFAGGFFQTSRVMKSFDQAGIKPQIMHTSSQLSTVEEMIAGDVAIGFLFREICMKHSNLVPISLSPRMNTNISLVMLKDAYVSAGMERFLAHIRKLFPDNAGMK